MNLAGRSATVWGLVLAIAVAWYCAPAGATEAATAVEIGTFENPTYVAVAPGEPSLLFVVERAGRIRALQDDGPLAAPFLDITKLYSVHPTPGRVANGASSRSLSLRTTTLPAVSMSPSPTI